MVHSAHLPVRWNGRSLEDALTRLSEKKQGDSIVALMKSVAQLDGSHLDAQKYTIGISACGRAKLWKEVREFETCVREDVVCYEVCTRVRARNCEWFSWPFQFDLYIGNDTLIDDLLEIVVQKGRRSKLFQYLPRSSNSYTFKMALGSGLAVWVSGGFRLFQYSLDPYFRHPEKQRFQMVSVKEWLFMTWMNLDDVGYFHDFGNFSRDARRPTASMRTCPRLKSIPTSSISTLCWVPWISPCQRLF